MQFARIGALPLTRGWCFCFAYNHNIFNILVVVAVCFTTKLRTRCQSGVTIRVARQMRTCCTRSIYEIGDRAVFNPGQQNKNGMFVVDRCDAQRVVRDWTFRYAFWSVCKFDNIQLSTLSDSYMQYRQELFGARLHFKVELLAIISLQLAVAQIPRVLKFAC